MLINRISDRSTIIIAIVFILIVFCLVFKSFFRIDSSSSLLSHKVPSKSVMEIEAPLIQLGKENDSVLQQNVSSRAVILSSGAPQIITAAGTPAEKEVLDRWFESRGRFSPESLKDYESYDVETLNKLVSSGDLKAMNVLTHLYLSEKYLGSDGAIKAMQLSKYAAAYGSTDALQMYSVLYGNAKQEFVSQKLKYDDLVEVLAWKNTAALRGDMTWNNVARFDIESSGVNLTNSDKLRIAQRSQEIYSELLANRKELGLGDFDNSRPVEADRFFKYLYNFMEVNK